MWIINVRSGEALDCVEVCFYFGGNFSVLVVDGLVWNDGVSLLVLAILSLQVDCGYFEKSFGEFGMCLSAYLMNDVIFLIFWTVDCLLASRLFFARFSAYFVWILLKMAFVVMRRGCGMWFNVMFVQNSPKLVVWRWLIWWWCGGVCLEQQSCWSLCFVDGIYDSCCVLCCCQWALSLWVDVVLCSCNVHT